MIVNGQEQHPYRCDRCSDTGAILVAHPRSVGADGEVRHPYTCFAACPSCQAGRTSRYTPLHVVEALMPAGLCPLALLAEFEAATLRRLGVETVPARAPEEVVA